MPSLINKAEMTSRGLQPGGGAQKTKTQYDILCAYSIRNSWLDSGVLSIAPDSGALSGLGL